MSMRHVTRFRSNTFTALAIAAVAAGFLSGAMAGTATTMVMTPPSVEQRCSSAADPIACLIQADDEEEASEPP